MSGIISMRFAEAVAVFTESCTKQHGYRKRLRVFDIKIREKKTDTMVQ